MFPTTGWKYTIRSQRLYESLEQGKVDAVIQDGPNAYYYIKTTDGTKLEIVGDEFNQCQAPYAIAVSRDCAEANEGIVEQIQSGN